MIKKTTGLPQCLQELRNSRARKPQSMTRIYFKKCLMMNSLYYNQNKNQN